MSLPIREILTEEEFGIILKALDKQLNQTIGQVKRYTNHRIAESCVKNQINRDKFSEEAFNLEQIINKLANSWD